MAKGKTSICPIGIEGDMGWALGSGVPCPCCVIGTLWAGRDGFGEVDSYICDSCHTWYCDSNDMDPNDGAGYEPGDACDIRGGGFWQFDPTPRKQPGSSPAFKAEYVYLGDRLTDPALRGLTVDAERVRGYCVRGRGSMLVIDAVGKHHVVIARLLRKRQFGS